jgi:hypothetical protein
MSYLKIAQKALKEGKGKNFSPVYITFGEDRKVVCGRFLHKAAVASSVSDGFYDQYLFDSDDGLIKFHLGSATDNEAGILMVAGKVYHIEYLGKEKLKGAKSVNKYHIEEIPYDDGEDKK